jgi:hypothetical protein
VRVTGTVRWNYYTGSVRANVTATGPGGGAEHLRMTWSLQVRAARAHIAGAVAGRPLRLQMLAP